MPVSRISFLIVFCAVVLFLNGCSETDATNNNSNARNSANINPEVQIVPQDNVEELGKIIKLNVLPEEVSYIETSLNTKNSENKLVAVLKFSGENAAQIVAQAEKIKLAAPIDVDAETWFPEELIAQSSMTGDQFLKGATYAANDFLQTPYSNGKLTRINDSNYFILELTTF